MVDRKNYSEFRRMVLKSYFTSHKSLSEVGKEFQVKPSTVHQWTRRYGSEFSRYRIIQQDIHTFHSVSNTPTIVKKNKLTPEQMEQRILELEQQLKNEQMRSTVLDQMIEIAERDLKLSIRKKSGAKQFK